MASPVIESTALARSHGTPFHSDEFCKVIEASWPGIHEAKHQSTAEAGESTALFPAWLYSSCPRLDYYRTNVEPRLIGQVTASHALVGWFGGPIAKSSAAMTNIIQLHLEECRRDNSISFVMGFDHRSIEISNALLNNGYVVGQFHTNMVLPVDAAFVDDPLLGCKSKSDKRIRRRRWERGNEAGNRFHVLTPSEAMPDVNVIRSAVRKQNLQSEVFPEHFVTAVLNADLPNLEVLRVASSVGNTVAIGLNFCWRDVYYLWLGGNDPAANMAFPSDYLMHCTIRRAAALGCKEIQAGRSPYSFKMSYGFKVTPILAALAAPADKEQQAVASAWLAAQTQRHFNSYPEVRIQAEL